MFLQFYSLKVCLIDSFFFMFPRNLNWRKFELRGRHGFCTFRALIIFFLFSFVPLKCERFLPVVYTLYQTNKPLILCCCKTNISLCIIYQHLVFRSPNSLPFALPMKKNLGLRILITLAYSMIFLKFGCFQGQYDVSS